MINYNHQKDEVDEKYDPKLKADVIEAIIECGRSAAQVARL